MQPCREVSREEARRLKTIGAGVFVESGRAFRLKESTPPPPLSLPPGPIETACTITFSEIQANVGITGGGEIGQPANRNLVARVQQKLAVYPFEWDKNSPLPFAKYARPDLSIAFAG